MYVNLPVPWILWVIELQMHCALYDSLIFNRQVPPASRTRIIRYLEKQVYKDRPWEGAILSIDQTDLKAIQGDVFFCRFEQGIAQKC